MVPSVTIQPAMMPSWEDLKVASLKRVKEDVKEVQKGLECGILLEGFQDYKEGDSIQAFEISYREQKLS